MDEEEVICPVCYGVGLFLGIMGNDEHFQCRHCGIGFYREREEC
jgi:hypothetical protein